MTFVTTKMHCVIEFEHNPEMTVSFLAEAMKQSMPGTSIVRMFDAPEGNAILVSVDEVREFGTRQWVVHVDRDGKVVYDFGMLSDHEVYLAKKARIPEGHRIEVKEASS